MPMDPSLRDVLATYDPKRPLETAFTIPDPWYTDHRLLHADLTSELRRA